MGDWRKTDVDYWKLYGGHRCWAEVFWDKGAETWVWQVFDAGSDVDDGLVRTAEEGKAIAAQRLAEIVQDGAT
jgi:hypothetical protein